MAAVVAFTGTSTGKVYQVGKVYVTKAGVAKVAQADGTFKPLAGQSGVSQTKGSSQSQNVTFIVSDNNNKKYSVKGASVGAPSSRVASALVSELADEPRYSGTGAGVKRVASGPASSGVGAGAGTPGAYLGPFPSIVQTDPFTVNLQDRNEGVTSPIILGVPLPQAPWTSDAADIEQSWGESEFMSPTWFMNWGKVGIDVVVGGATPTSPGWAKLGNAISKPAPLTDLGVGTPQEYETYSPDFGGSLMFPTNSN